MMKTLHFYGSSDDTFGGYGPGGDDHDNCASMGPIRWKLETPDGDGLIVVGHYGAGESAAWMVGIEQLPDDDGGRPLPNWPITFGTAHEYSVGAKISCPDDTTLTLVRR